jgi:DNA-binding NarL/FixJ family response regulator
MKPKLRVLVIGGRGPTMQKLNDSLGEIQGIKVVAHFESGTDGINSYRDHDPNVVLVDIVTDGIGGLETARSIKEQSPDVKIIILSTEFNREFLHAVITLGFDGYVVKDAVPEILKEALHALVAGETFYSIR